MSEIKIHQFSPSAVKGDGIGNGMFYLQKILKELGFTSYIYAKDIDTPLKNSVLSYKKIDKSDKNQILLIHYSIYYDFSKWIDGLNLRKIMIYHNITPYYFFEKNSLLYNLCKKGVEYLPSLSKKVEGAIGVSALNSKELKENNFKNIKTIPLLVDTQKIIKAKWDKDLFDTIADDFNIIFIGRIAKNKAQHDLIKIANIYRNISPNFKLYIIGGTTDTSYQDYLKELISKYNLEDIVILTGKVSNEELYAYYRGADIFLCMSEHEGFGIPLIESMLFNVPIIAYNSSNIKSTLNGGGILFNKKSHSHIASTIHLLRENKDFKREIIKTQKRALKSYNHKEIVKKLVSYLNSIGVKTKEPIEENREDKIKYQFEGPFDSSYSLAILNRYSALAFESKYPNRVSLYPTEGGGDYNVNRLFLKQNPKVEKMYQVSKKAINAEVVFRNLYPPRVSGMRGDLNILNSYGWEESSFALEYIKQFNEKLDGITVMSEYVKRVLKHSGVTVPIEVVGLGVEHILEETPKKVDLKTNKKFKFLHISSCFPRKGVDLLLKAYTQTFSSKDNVTLIIKTFPNPHNRIEDDIKNIKLDPNAPEIILINRDLSDAHIAWLYQNSNALVAPSRGEGFGLPMAEAMLFRLPVITTAFGGAVDFCKNENSWLIDYSFQKAQTHLNLFNSYWVEPQLEDLKRLLKEQVNLDKETIDNKVEKAYNLISKSFRWQDYREKSENFIDKLKNQDIFSKKDKNIAWISSYNTKCGIAAYSEFLVEELKKDRYNITIYANNSSDIIIKDKEIGVIRCWKDYFDKNINNLIKKIEEQKPTHIVMNFNFGFFSMQNLKLFIETLNTIPITIIFHSTSDTAIGNEKISLRDIKDVLKKVKNILVHNIDDLNFLKELGVYNNIYIFPHGIKYHKLDTPRLNKKIETIGSYGFLLPHKGIIELIEAFSILKKTEPYLKLKLVNAIYPVPESKNYYKLCKKRIKELDLDSSIEFHTDFLSDDDSFNLLEESDLILMPYHNTKESSSASVRYAVSLMKPVLCTPQAIFNDVEDIVHFSSGFSYKEIATSIKKLIDNPELLYSKIEIQKRWIEEHDWENISKRLESFID